MNAREQPLDVKDFIWLVTFDFETFQRITSTFPRERANSNFIEKKIDVYLLNQLTVEYFGQICFDMKTT